MTTTLGSMGSQDSRTDKDADFSAYMSARQLSTTKSPGASPVTSGPTASTTPAASWPRRNGKSSLIPPSR